ncbi:hypothetical protein ACEUZ9_002782 [Paracoccus litorisediminis]|uniref:hypothetical protein n=1 Tax=Paracoccus litorisediminis TaxID=2006130 RepID=UPI00373295CF
MNNSALPLILLGAFCLASFITVHSTRKLGGQACRWLGCLLLAAISGTLSIGIDGALDRNPHYHILYLEELFTAGLALAALSLLSIHFGARYLLGKGRAKAWALLSPLTFGVIPTFFPMGSRHVYGIDSAEPRPADVLYPVATPIVRDPGIQKEPVQHDRAMAAIQYLPEWKEAWAELETAPEKYRQMFLRAANKDPHADPDQILAEINAQMDTPFLRPEHNRALIEMQSLGDEAAAEYRRVVDLLGEEANPQPIKDRLIERYGRPGGQALSGQNMSAASVEPECSPNQRSGSGQNEQESNAGARHPLLGGHDGFGI